MFSIGDMVMYGGTGVCAVEGITSLKLSGMDSERDYYVLRPLYQSGTIHTPVDGNKIPIRPVLTKTQAEELVDTIPTVNAVMCTEKNLSALRNHYQQQMSSFDCLDLIRMAKSIYAKKKDAESRQKKIGMTDEKYLRMFNAAIPDIQADYRKARAFDIIKSHAKEIKHFRFLLYMAKYWEENKTEVTKELLENYDLPYTVDEFHSLKEALK